MHLVQTSAGRTVTRTTGVSFLFYFNHLIRILRDIFNPLRQDDPVTQADIRVEEEANNAEVGYFSYARSLTELSFRTETNKL
jgi:hypothetical protein